MIWVPTSAPSTGGMLVMPPRLLLGRALELHLRVVVRLVPEAGGVIQHVLRVGLPTQLRERRRLAIRLLLTAVFEEVPQERCATLSIA